MKENNSSIRQDQEEIDFAVNYANPMWRICNLYKIIAIDDVGRSRVIDFRPNAAQLKFIEQLHYRNLILKARQLGFTTLVAILWLDHALHNSNANCVMIAQNREAAQKLFQNKIKFAYNNLPEILRKRMPLVIDNTSELKFGHNGSSISVVTSARSGTIDRLHISELGKICADNPKKASEIETGTLPAVPSAGIAIIESTAEGEQGLFYDMVKQSMELQESGKELSQIDFKFHFFPWFDDQRYEMQEGTEYVSQKDHDYFDSIEEESGRKISIEKRTWYCATRKSVLRGSEEKMWQEYPSTPKEAFQKSNEGCYYTQQITAARKGHRILNFAVENVPVNTFWDVGNTDGTSIWFHQKVGMEDRFIDYYEAHGEDLRHYMLVLQKKDYIYNKHFLPHDAGHKRLGERNESIQDQLKKLGLKNSTVLPVASSINAGIQLVRQYFPSCYFRANETELGVRRLSNYRHKKNNSTGRFMDEPLHDENSEGADAFRQFAQAKAAGLISLSGEAEFKLPSFISQNSSFGHMG